MNSIFQIFNDPYIQEMARQAQKAQQEHQEQVENVLESAEKLRKFLDSLDKIKPEYRGDASRMFCAIVFEYMCKHTYF